MTVQISCNKNDLHLILKFHFFGLFSTSGAMEPSWQTIRTVGINQVRPGLDFRFCNPVTAIQFNPRIRQGSTRRCGLVQMEGWNAAAPDFYQRFHLVLFQWILDRWRWERNQWVEFSTEEFPPDLTDQKSKPQTLEAQIS